MLNTTDTILFSTTTLKRKNMAKPDVTVDFLEATKRLKDKTVVVKDEEVAERIKVLVDTIEERGLEALTYPEIAQLCGVNEKNVWNWARDGKISKHKLPLLAEVLGTTVEYILTGKGDSDFEVVDIGEESFNVETESAVGLRMVPIVESIDFANVMTFKEDPTPSISALISGWKQDKEFAFAAIPFRDANDIAIPDFALQMTSSIMDGLPKGSLCFFSSKMLPHNGDFSLWATKQLIGGEKRTVVCGGYTHFDGVADTFPLDHLMFDQMTHSKVTLTRAPFVQTIDDIVLKEPRVEGDVIITSRRFLGTLVAKQQWMHERVMRRQTRLTARLTISDELARIPSGRKIKFEFE